MSRFVIGAVAYLIISSQAYAQLPDERNVSSGVPDNVFVAEIIKRCRDMYIGDRGVCACPEDKATGSNKRCPHNSGAGKRFCKTEDVKPKHVALARENKWDFISRQCKKR